MPEIPYLITEKDAIAAQRLSMKWSHRALFINGILWVLLLIGLYLFLKHIDPEQPAFMSVSLIGIGWPIITVLLRLFLIPRTARRNFHQNKLLLKPQDMTWDEKGLNFKSEDSHNVVNWKDLYKWKKDKDFFLLYLSDAQFICIPKRLFSDENQSADFERHLENSALKYVRP